MAMPAILAPVGGPEQLTAAVRCGAETVPAMRPALRAAERARGVGSAARPPEASGALRLRLRL